MAANPFAEFVDRPNPFAEFAMPATQQAEIPSPRQLTTGQRVYQSVRPYAAPLVEAGGAIAGGLIGGTAGTFGAGPIGTVTGGVFGLAEDDPPCGLTRFCFWSPSTCTPL
jgi:hypothetical protein